MIISVLMGTLSYGQNINTLTEKANKGNAEAQCKLGVAYDKGEGVAQSSEKAVYWWQQTSNFK
ncbi:hypothetical protein CGC56_00865 [Capnocytophaga canimorsus]|nr:hypothetical protein CGC56_00865 [Capnocytophaga canimorsus]